MAHHLQVRNLQAGIGGQADPRRAGPGHPHGRDPRAHGAQRLGQEHARERAHGSPVLRGDRAARVPLDGEDYLALTTSERALRGVFLAFQYPVEIAGVTVGKFLKRAIELRGERQAA